MPSISTHNILIIGGTSGIGFAVASQALSQDCTVTIASSSPSRVSSALTRLQNAFPSKLSQIKGQVIDLSAPEIEKTLISFLEKVTDGKKNLLDHIIVTAARLADVKPLAEMNIEETLNETQYSLSTPLAIGKLAPSYLHPRPSSSIILTGGRVADKPMPNYALYSFYAAGLHGLVKSLALELAPVRVNLVSPGATKTEMWGGEEQRDMVAKVIGEKALLGKVGIPEEVSEGYVYFMRDWNATGVVVRSEGGAGLL